MYATQGAAQKFDNPQAQLRARRLQERHAELRQAASAGLWRVHVLAGGMAALDAAEVAGLLCASADLDGLPYGLVPAPECGTLDMILDDLHALRAEPRGVQAPAAPADLEPWRQAPQPGGFAVATRPGPGQDEWRRRSPLPSQTAAARQRDASQDDDPAPASPFYGSSAVLAVLARPPAREIPGSARFVLRPEFDTVPETAAAGTPDTGGRATIAGAGIRAGELLDRNRMPVGQLTLPRSSLNRHTFVSGATGAGKSQTVRALLEQATAADIPWLVIEPAKAEYSHGMAARLPGTEVIRIRPGDADQAAAGINPLEPAAWADGTRFPLQTHADLVKSLFLAAFEADEPFPQVLNAALTRVYDEHGWDLVLGEPKAPGICPAYPALGDLQAAADLVVRAAAYGPEVERNVRGFITVRLGSLRLGTPGRFFEGGHQLDFGKLLQRNVVLEIEDVGDDQDKAFLIGAVLIRLTEHLRLRQRHQPGGPPGLRHLTVLEEAHRLLRNPGPGQRGAAAKAVELFAALFAEVRAYGEGLVVAEQIPSKLIPDVLKNTAVKIVHRLPASDDRQAVGATMNLTEAQDQYIVTLAPGEAAVFADGADYPWLVRMPDGTGREAGPAATASPAGIITPRSASCGPGCQASACTLRQMRAAQRAAETDTRIILWAELAVLAHLTGWTMPLPGRLFGDALRAMDTRLRDCALAHAVDAAVACRAAVISSRVSPGPLAVHVTAAMRQGLADGTWLCDREEPQYLAPPYRWVLVSESLQAASRDGQADRHPRSAEWEQAYGRDIPGESCARQFSAVRRWYEDDQRDTRMISAVAWGLRPDTAIERAVGARAGDEDWADRLARQLEVFHKRCRWPRDYLKAPRPAQHAREQA